MEVHYAPAATVATGEDEEFEIVEKVQECLKTADDAPPAGTLLEGQGQEMAPRSFFDQQAKVDEPTANKANSTAERYAHLPAILAPKLLQAPASIPPLFPFNRTTLYLLLGPESAQQAVTAVTLRATSSAGPLELTIPVRNQSAVPRSGVPTIHQLAARKAVQELEERRGWLQAATTTVTADKDSVGGKEDREVRVKEKYAARFDEIVEREAVRLGEKFQVAGKWTSWVAVRESRGRGQKDGEKSAGEGQQGLRNPGSPQLEGDSGDDEDMGFTLVDEDDDDDDDDNYGQLVAAPPSSRKRRPAMKSTGGKAPRRQLAIKRCRRAYPSVLDSANRVDMKEEEEEEDADGEEDAGKDEDEYPDTTAVMHTLIALQTFSGAWPLNKALLDALAIRRSARAELEVCGGSDEVKATALAIAYLETKVEEERDVWEMIVAKARAWLGEQGSVVVKGVERVVEEAAGYL